MNLFYILYVHLVTFWMAPKSYTKYMFYCITHAKQPKTQVLAKLLRIAYVSRSMLGVQKPAKKIQTRTSKVGLSRLEFHKGLH